MARPLKLKQLYPTVDELQERIDSFFETYRVDTPRKPTAEWFCLHLGIDYDTWLNYVKGSQLTLAKEYGKDYNRLVGALSRARLMLLASMVDLSLDKHSSRGAELNLRRYGAVRTEDEQQSVKISIDSSAANYAK